MIARNFRLSAWLTRRHLAIPSVFMNRGLICVLRLDRLPGIHLDEINERP